MSLCASPRRQNAVIDWPPDDTPKPDSGAESISTPASDVGSVTFDAAIDIDSLVRRKLYFLEMREMFRRQEAFEERRPMYGQSP